MELHHQVGTDIIRNQQFPIALPRHKCFLHCAERKCRLQRLSPLQWSDGSVRGPKMNESSVAENQTKNDTTHRQHVITHVWTCLSEIHQNDWLPTQLKVGRFDGSYYSFQEKLGMSSQKMAPKKNRLAWHQRPCRWAPANPHSPVPRCAAPGLWRPRPRAWRRWRSRYRGRPRQNLTEMTAMWRWHGSFENKKHIFIYYIIICTSSVYKHILLWSCIVLWSYDVWCIVVCLDQSVDRKKSQYDSFVSIAIQYFKWATCAAMCVHLQLTRNHIVCGRQNRIWGPSRYLPWTFYKAMPSTYFWKPKWQQIQLHDPHLSIQEGIKHIYYSGFAQNINIQNHGTIMFGPQKEVQNIYFVALGEKKNCLPWHVHCHPSTTAGLQALAPRHPPWCAPRGCRC